MTFRVGMKVVCIGIPCSPKPGKQFPVERAVYTIREIAPYRTWSLLLFEEVINAPVQTDCGVCEQGFNSAYFRPAVFPKQEVSFTTGADPDSEQYDNRRRIPARVREWGASA